MHEPPKLSHGAVWVITEECLFPSVCNMKPRFCTAAGAVLRRYSIQIKMPTLQILLNMRNDHVSLGHQHTAAGHQFKPFNERQVVQAGTRYGASIDHYTVEYRHRRDLAGARRCPFDIPQDAFV